MFSSAVPKFKYYLFDLDGALLDTSEMIYQSFCHISKEYGVAELSKSEVIALMGVPLAQILRDRFPARIYENLAEVVARFNAFQKASLSRLVKPFPGVLAGLAALKERGCRLGVVTSRSESSLGPLMQEFGLEIFFDLVVTPADTTAHKPEPEPLLFALRRFCAQAHEAVYVGDAEVDLRCARAAGVAAVLVGWSQNETDKFSVLPDYRIDSLEQLVAE